jgi:hypothetical protein
MAWSQARSQKRIEGFLASVPKGAVDVRRFYTADPFGNRIELLERVI